MKHRPLPPSFDEGGGTAADNGAGQSSSDASSSLPPTTYPPLPASLPVTTYPPLPPLPAPSLTSPTYDSDAYCIQPNGTIGVGSGTSWHATPPASQTYDESIYVAEGTARLAPSEKGVSDFPPPESISSTSSRTGSRLRRLTRRSGKSASTDAGPRKRASSSDQFHVADAEIPRHDEAGFCSICNLTQTHSKQTGLPFAALFGAVKYKPLTVPGRVYRGYCLHCHDLEEVQWMTGSSGDDNDETMNVTAGGKGGALSRWMPFAGNDASKRTLGSSTADDSLLRDSNEEDDERSAEGLLCQPVHTRDKGLGTRALSVGSSQSPFHDEPLTVPPPSPMAAPVKKEAPSPSPDQSASLGQFLDSDQFRPARPLVVHESIRAQPSSSKDEETTIVSLPPLVAAEEADAGAGGMGKGADNDDERSCPLPIIGALEDNGDEDGDKDAAKIHVSHRDDDNDEDDLGSLPSLVSTSQAGTQNEDDSSSLPSLMSMSAMESVDDTCSLPSLMDAEEADRSINALSRSACSHGSGSVQGSRSGRSRMSIRHGGRRSRRGGQPVMPEDDTDGISTCSSLPSLMDAEEADAALQRPSRLMMGIPMIDEEDSDDDEEHSSQQEENYNEDNNQELMDAVVSRVKAPADSSRYCSRAFVVFVLLGIVAFGVGMGVGLSSTSDNNDNGDAASGPVNQDADSSTGGGITPPITVPKPTPSPSVSAAPTIVTTASPTKLPMVLIWDKVGHDIVPPVESGTKYTTSFGARVSLSAPGDKIAVSAPLATDNQDQGESGMVMVFEYKRTDSEEANSGEKWVQSGQMLHGQVKGDRAGTGLALSPNGSKLAIGYPGNDGGYVKVFEYREGLNDFGGLDAGWVQMGQTLRSEDAGANDQMGFNLALDYEGITIAVSSPGFGTDNASRDTGKVDVYKFDTGGKKWKEMGSSASSTLLGIAPGDQFGTGLDLSYGGDVLAVGAPNNGNRVDGAGHIRVYKFQDDDWVQLDREIPGNSENDCFGKVVSLDADGKWLASGSRGADSTDIADAGRVRAFSYEQTVGWSQYGFDVDGVGPLDGLGNDLDMSADSFRIIAAGLNDVSEGTVGVVRVYEEDMATWYELGGELGGMSLGALSSTPLEREWLNGGPSVSISYYGSVVAVGFENVALEDDEGGNEERGVVRVHSWRTVAGG